MKNKNIIVLGSLNMDLVIASKEMPKAGETIKGFDFITNPGGKGANQACACGKLGGTVYMIGSVGNDLYGKQLIQVLEENQVNTDYISFVNQSTGVTFIILVEQDNRIIINPGANDFVDANQINACLENVSFGDIFVCQLEIPLNKVQYGLHQAKKKGLYTILNPAPACLLPDELLENVDLIILNETEAEFLTKIEPNNDENKIKICQFFKAKGIKNTIITLGNKGSVTMDDERLIHINTHIVETVDSTAAGDSYVGSMATALAKHIDLIHAMKISTSVAAITVTRKGAIQSLPSKEDLDAFMKQ